MKIKYLKFKNWFLATILTALGVAGCESANKTSSATVVATSELEAEEARLRAESDAAARDMMDAEKRRKAAEDDARDEIAVMYGVPTARFVVKGKVLDPKGKPIQGMQVILLDRSVDATPDDLNLSNEYVLEHIRRSSDTTASDGTFNVVAQDYPTEYMRLFVRDIDGPSHGNYRNELINVEFGENDRSQSGAGWNVGTYEKEITVRPEPNR